MVRRGWSERLYRALLRLYPEPFRARFGDELVQLSGDLLRDARAGRAGRGVVRTWLGLLLDVAVTAPAEHLEQRRVAHSLSRPASAVTKALGFFGILGGLILVAGYIPSIDWNGYFVHRLLIFNAGAIAIAIAVHRRQASRSRALSLVATGLAVVGNAWYPAMFVISFGRPQFPEPDPQFRTIFFMAAIALWLGAAIFGLVALRLGAVSRWASALLAVGSVIAFLAMTELGDRLPWLAGLIGLTAPVHLWGVALLGFGWIFLGIDVATRRRQATASAPPAIASASSASEPIESGAELRG